jgi:CBS domain-containing protein
MSIESVAVSAVMTRDVKTASEASTVRSVAELMDRYGIGSIVIVKEKGVPVGIITERDIVRLVGRANMSFAVQVQEVMSRPVITADTMTSLRDALLTMQTKNIRRLPVMEKGRMVGIITDKDIFRAIIRNQALLTGIISDSILIEYKPVYDRFAEFMLSEMSHPGGR